MSTHTTPPTKVLSIVGTRPEAIKMAPIVRALEADPRFESCLCLTGQHASMLQHMVELFELSPAHNLELMQPGQTLTDLTAALFANLGAVISKEKPGWIVAQGDTTTVMVASLLAYYNRIPFGHVEAGLRTGNLYQPFPEEANRRIADLVATHYYAPTQRSTNTLLAENVAPKNIFTTGNTVIDALLHVAKLPCSWEGNSPLAPLLPIKQAKEAGNKKIILITAHRRESFGGTFQNMCRAIRSLADTHGEHAHFIYPVHLNPNVQAPVNEILAGHPSITLTQPLDYLHFVHLMKAADIILTDSGGIQEEAPSLNIPVLVMRDVTERQEGVEAGVVKLVGTQPENIARGVTQLLEDPAAYAAMQQGANPYGDGQAAARILNALANYQA